MIKIFFVYFFFQAEDGIRDYDVTGVQTCALPILVYGELNFEEGEYNRAFYVMDHASTQSTLGMFEDPRTRR